MARTGTRMLAIVWLGWMVVLAAAAVGVAEELPEGLLPVKATWKEVDGQRGVAVTSPDGKQVYMMPSGRVLVKRNGCDVAVKMEPTAGGFDLLVHVENPTDKPLTRPEVVLHGIRKSAEGRHLDARNVGSVHEHRPTKEQPRIRGSRFGYTDMYSPVAMLSGKRFAIGVSLMYPVLELKHLVAFGWYMEGGARSGQFVITIELSSRGEADRIAPGEKADYRVAVRFAEVDHWLAALEPYRRYFRRMYGKVRYTADRRPVFAASLSMAKFAGDDNPRGYGDKNRMDLVGWTKTVDMLAELGLDNGYRRCMLWKASGVYRKGQNMPVEFMTEWPEKMVETADELERLRKRGMSIGLWWGHAADVSAGWNSGKMWVRDMDNPENVAAGDRELKLAVKYGVTEVGLDAFSHMPLWDRVRWMKHARAKFPTLRTITEPADCDIMHTLAPTFVWYHRQKQPAVLADWLNPGHETWLFMQARQVKREWFDNAVTWRMPPVTMWKPVKHDPETFKTKE